MWLTVLRMWPAMCRVAHKKSETYTLYVDGTIEARWKRFASTTAAKAGHVEHCVQGHRSKVKVTLRSTRPLFTAQSDAE